MDIEFDEAKSISNEKKHGIDFNEPKKLWNGPVVIQSSFYEHELRELHIGFVEQILWTAVITIETITYALLALEEAEKMKEHFTIKHKHHKTSKTTAENLEARFDAGKNVLDYFDPASARVIWPKHTASEKVTSLRKTAGMTQQEFSKAICISPRTLQQWEQGRREPEGPAKALLRLMALKPSLIKLLASS